MRWYLAGIWFCFCHADNAATCTDDQLETAACGLPDTFLGTPESDPKLVFRPQYPLSQFGTQQMAFNKFWVKPFKWLEYSIAKNSTVCFPCRMYGRQNIRTNKDTLLSNSDFILPPVSTRKVPSTCQALPVGRVFKSTQSHLDVIEQLNTASNAEITEAAIT